MKKRLLTCFICDETSAMQQNADEEYICPKCGNVAEYFNPGDFKPTNMNLVKNETNIIK